MSKSNNDYLSKGLYFIPLGGSEQFGINLNVYACDGQLLAVDCGLGFANERMPGIDLLLPDPSFLEKNKKKLQALIITHAHEDHIGAVAYLWKRLGCPIYTTPFTAVCLHEKLADAKVKDVQVTVMKPMKHAEIGNFDVQFLPVSHSIPDAVALFIQTANGNVLHSGDWNLDPSPVVGYKSDAAAFKEAGKTGVIAYIGDSTNAEVLGRTGTESATLDGLYNEIKKCKGKVAVTIFSSNIGRIVNIANAAKKAGRKTAIVGRSLHRMVDAAARTGYLKDAPGFISDRDLDDYMDDQILMIVTGSQGEPRSALAKIARGEFQGIKLNKRDTVIFSSRPIPGNETNINEVRNNLTAAGVEVITPSESDNIIHVSGHPCRDEIIDMLDWVKPNVVIPVHGERIQLEAQARIARDKKIEAIVPNNGSVIKLAPGKPEVVDHIETGILAVDQKRIISANHTSIAERRKLQYSGTVHVSIAVDDRGAILGTPKIDTVGLLGDGEDKILEDLHEEVHAIIDEMTWEEREDDEALAEEIRVGIRRFVMHVLGIKPKTTVHVLRV